MELRHVVFRLSEVQTAMAMLMARLTAMLMDMLMKMLFVFLN